MVVASRGPLSQFKRNLYLCWAILLLSGTLYGGSFSLMKVAVSSGGNPLGLVFWFAFLAGAVLCSELAVRGKIRDLDPKLLRFCLPWGILSVVLPNVCFFYASREIPASLIALGIALVPILTLTGAILLRQEQLTPGRLFGIGLGAIGLMLVLVPKTSLPEAGDTFFVMAAFFGAACYAAEHLYIEMRAPAEVAVDKLLFYMFASVATLLLPIVLITGTFLMPQWPVGAAEGALIAVAAITLLDYFLITLLVLWAGPVFTSQAAYVVTLAGMAWGVILFQERHSGWIWMAIIALMLGLAFVRPRSGDRPRRQQVQSEP
jgi:drug/metabolite transporter (DMT)-like permease